MKPGRAKPVRVTVVPHTHWDRAWYLPFEDFRAELVEVIDGLLDALEADEDLRFTLDGQTIVLEDYLEIRPDHAERLARLVGAGRLMVGPWYVLPDEFLVSGEALVRNLLAGSAIAERFGRRMNVGYVPDPFGHIGQLPQLLEGFGLEGFVFQRGLDPHSRGGPTELSWEGADGTRVLSKWLRSGYGNLDRPGHVPRPSYSPRDAQPADLELGARVLCEAVERELASARSGAVLLCNGTDHRPLQPEIGQIAARAARAMPGVEIRIGTLEDFLADMRAGLEGEQVEPIRGELSYRHGDLLQGVHSARVQLKQANQEVQALLERFAEPLDALEWQQAGGAGARASRRGLLDHAWRTLLKNHPHDDICGCGVDQTHREMGWRFERAAQVGKRVIADAARGLGERFDRPEGVCLLVFNPQGCARTELLRASIDLRPEEIEKELEIEDGQGRRAACQLLRREPCQHVELDRVFEAERCELAFLAEDLPACGLRAYALRAGRSKPAGRPGELRVEGQSIRGPHNRLVFGPDGRFELHDRRSGRCFDGLHVFEDAADCGDEYDFSPLAGGETLRSNGARAEIDCLHGCADFVTMRVTAQMDIPLGLTRDRRARLARTARCGIESQITVYAHTPRVDVTTRLVNRCRDHRLRVLFGLEVDTDEVLVDEAFDVVSRGIEPPLPRAGMPPYPTCHQQRFLCLRDARGGLAVLNRGLAEYEVYAEGARKVAALTLLRAVGHLSRDDLVTRPFHAGPFIATPGAQCPGPHVFHYALLPCGGGDEIDPLLLREARSFCEPPLLLRLEGPAGAGELRAETSFVALEPDCLELSAVKRAERLDGLIVRFFNPTARTVKAGLRFWRRFESIERVRLDESDVEGGLLARGKDRVEIDCGPKKIVTLKLRA
ncbi:MAG: hypothetical protein JXR96_24025 [Deltaproteobacteria bacterium]|nr:hypothetical protein [Deltaproteobacteria bacterium]